MQSRSSLHRDIFSSLLFRFRNPFTPLQLASSCRLFHKIIRDQNYYWGLWLHFYMGGWFNHSKYKYHEKCKFSFWPDKHGRMIKKFCYSLSCFGISINDDRHILLTQLTKAHPDFAMWCSELDDDSWKKSSRTLGYCQSRFLETYGQEKGFAFQCKTDSHFHKYEETLPLHLKDHQIHLKDHHQLSLDKFKFYMKDCIFVLKAIMRLDAIEIEKKSIYATIKNY